MSDWNGQGLPPVGTICEMHSNEEMTVKVLAYGKHGRDDAALVCETYHGVDDQMHGVLCNHVEFRPIRDAEDRALDALKSATKRPGRCNMLCDSWAKAIYAAIRDGKVPGVKLEDGV